MVKKKTVKKSKVLAHKDFLSLLARCKTKTQQRKLLDFANRDQIQSVLEIILNLNRLVLKEGDKKKLCKYKKPFGILLKTKKIGAQKKILNQTGTGFLSFLLPAVVSAIGGLIK